MAFTTQAHSIAPAESPNSEFLSESGLATLRRGSLRVRTDLNRFGPTQFPSVACRRSGGMLCELPGVNEMDAEAYCRSFARSHYENFSIVSWLVPASLRQDFANVYSFCRWADDLADESSSRDEAVGLLNWWRELLRDAYEGERKHPVWVALGKTIDRHEIGEGHFLDLIQAFQIDQVKNRYESDDEIEEYCRGSAHPVGRIILRLAECDSQESLELSDSICSGLQIANFCQDLKVDGLRNRIYLPRDRWKSGPNVELDLLKGISSPGLVDALREWCHHAESKLVQGHSLVLQTPTWLSRDLQVIVRGGLEILRVIEKSNFDVWSRPVEVSKIAKIRLALQAIVSPKSLSISRLTKN